MEYVSIHNHTVYSLFDGLIKPETLAEGAKHKGMNAVGITDHGSMSGCIKFYKSCQQLGIKPLLGVEAFYVDDCFTKEKKE